MTVNKFKFELRRFLLFQKLTGITIICLEFKSDSSYEQIKQFFFGLNIRLNNVEFQFFKKDKAKKYIILYGIRSIIGFNPDLPVLLQNIIQCELELPKIRINQILDSTGIAYVAEKFKDYYNILIYIYNNKEFDGIILDAMMLISITKNLKNYHVVSGESLANKLFVSKKASPEVLFLENFLNISDYKILKNQVIDISTGKIVYFSEKHLLESWDDIFLKMCQNFPFEAPSLDRLFLKENFLLKNVGRFFFFSRFN